MDKKTHNIVDGINSALWFLMDGFYLFGWKTGAYFLIIPVISTAIFSLLYGEKRADVFFSTLALNLWIIMNYLWIIGDMESIPSVIIIAKVFFIVGLVMVGISMLLSGDWRKTLSSFRRMRIK